MKKIIYSKNIVKKVCIILFSILLVTVTNNYTYALTPSLQTTTAKRNATSWTWAYYERGYRDVNCLAYAITQGTAATWCWPWGARNPTIEEAKAYMRSLGFQVFYDKDNCSTRQGWHVYAYADTSGLITHFATSIGNGTSGVIRAKWGQCEVFTHNSTDPYYTNSYGKLAFNCMR